MVACNSQDENFIEHDWFHENMWMFLSWKIQVKHYKPINAVDLNGGEMAEWFLCIALATRSTWV